jgi:threonine dehydrogenase-like Zn-dependent dehydrogenase
MKSKKPVHSDVSIEVSGNERALQSAIDYTRNGGRIIVGSWYGNSDVTLKLGIDFHRSSQNHYDISS